MKFVRLNLLPLILALTVGLLTVASSTMASEEKLSLCPRANLLSHWHNHFPMNPEIPSFLLSRSSPLTAAQVATLSSYIDAHTLNTPTHLSDFCSEANLMCSNNMPSGDLDAILPNMDNRRYNSGWMGEHRSSSILPDMDNRRYNDAWMGAHRPNSISPNMDNRRYNDAWMGAHRPSSLLARLEPGLYFREANITAGQKLHIADIRDKLPKTPFLPKCLADKLPFGSKSLQSLIELLGVGRLQEEMSRTVSDCEVPPEDGERKLCVKSIEAMADFAVETVGSMAEVLATQTAEGWGQEATVVNVIARNGGQVTPTLGCHRSMFPYLVYYCHSLSGVKVYEVELRIANGAEEKRNRAVAVCHMETSKWSAEHICFKVLESGPGKTEVCHFMYEGEFAWIARESPLKEAAGLPDGGITA